MNDHTQRKLAAIESTFHGFSTSTTFPRALPWPGGVLPLRGGRIKPSQTCRLFSKVPICHVGLCGFKLLVLSLLLFCAVGCRTLPPLPASDFKQPGWTVREGQAVWRQKRGSPEIAGDILLATRADGRAFVQFNKTPFPLVIAQRTANAWEIESPAQNVRYAGRGKPPKRMIFLYLPDVLSGGPTPKGWTWQPLEDKRWRLENPRSGEYLEGYFFQ
jgi:hypothetical protein